MYHILNHLKFLLTATDQHGVHSPFIYNYVTKCLYTKKKYSRRKSQNILLKSISYFGAEGVWLPAENDSIKKAIRHEFPRIQFENGPYDILFANPFEAEILISRASKENKIRNDSMLLIDGIYTDPTRTSLWKNIKNNKSVTVTVDMFHCAAVFFRKEQAEEHFKIRL